MVSPFSAAAVLLASGHTFVLSACSTCKRDIFFGECCVCICAVVYVLCLSACACVGACERVRVHE